MSLILANLDTETRTLMLQEINSDIGNGRLYLSPRLSEVGRRDFPELLRVAAANHDDPWLASELSQGGRLNLTEARKLKSGTIQAKVPHDANEMLAEGEFNRFYLRALCLRAQGGVLVVYRAKQVARPRSESEMKIGVSINADTLLADLRQNIGIDTALGLPPGPNSGLSAKLP